MATSFGERVDHVAGITTFLGGSVVPGTVATFPGYSLSNFAGDRKTFSASESTAANIASTVATLMSELIAKKIING